ncbi:bifunctional 4-hydroxy-2-oxoglutarate aldolase/2-dehydro-3-deoxy-phosphogluconate aldolase [Vallitalea longa]|nr:bifunctional 4-hydroxy-2-oxoglutarate aldolase/2-dehydro-3-deoxy-phosphogluconate aldolase [Vallitalea longa]
MDNYLKQIYDSKIIAIVRGIEKEKGLKVVEALAEGGIRCVEVTFNTNNAVEIIKDIKKEFGNEILIGAGTVLDVENAKRAIDAGAKFVLSPSLHEDVIKYCKQNNVISVPGAFTATEVVMADKWGADIVKIFPAGALGIQYIKMLRGPLDDVKLMPVGGIGLDNIKEFLECGSIAVGVGGSLVNKKFIENNQYDKLKELAQEYTKTVESIEI